ncbi:MAG: 1,4-alpha-glucan branching enzyme [Chlamydia sp. 32-24]|nr:MAG: 1,4-alpha-glucan branching enzyme [Chlamydia sp. 32-24]
MNQEEVSVAFQELIDGHSYNPHRCLGFHPEDKVIRFYRPDASQMFIEVKGNIVETKKVHEAGFFEYSIDESLQSHDYRIFHSNGLLSYDPYSFFPTIGELDFYLFSSGTHYQAYKILGANFAEQEGIKGIRFAVWAPSAKSISVVSDFNNWDGRVNPMRSLGSSGIWELFIPDLPEGIKYKFEIRTADNSLLIKSDPYAFASELRPSNASIIANIENFNWTDKVWLEKRIKNKGVSPLLIYEVHLGSWKKNDGQFMNYKELAKELVSYCTHMGFTHVELLPIQEHPLDESWGYQVTGFFAVTSRYGTPKDFQWFVNYLHNHNIGVILDWVPGHFPADDFSLSRFDGTALYEHADPKKGWHPHWHTYIFNYGRLEVKNFLIANALFWFDLMHIDGLRVDAVASMLYLDYGRENGEWIPNHFGGKENLEAIEFLKHLNSIIHQKFPGTYMIAEESTSFPKVTMSVEEGGLGFDLKWNMGWMNDTLRYFSKEGIHRKYHHDDLTFGLIYAFSEKFISVLSHDEVVHGKKSLLAKMPGDVWQQFANVRLLYSYMICQPGKKLLFMGGEIGQWNEWACKGEMEWFLLQFPIHHSLQTMIKDINHFYQNYPALWENDSSYQSFEWIDFNDRDNSVISYLRKGKKQCLLCVHHFTPNFYSDYFIPLKNVEEIREVFNTDEERYSGSGKNNLSIERVKDGINILGIKIQLAPLATMIFEVTFTNLSN